MHEIQRHYDVSRLKRAQSDDGFEDCRHDFPCFAQCWNFYRRRDKRLSTPRLHGRYMDGDDAGRPRHTHFYPQESAEIVGVDWRNCL